MDEICDIEITAPEADWLVNFTRSLVNDRLVASGNLFHQVRSIYRWLEEVEDRSEVIVKLHTRQSLVPQIIERVNAQHPYQVPGIRITEIKASPAYHRWVLEATEPRDS